MRKYIRRTALLLALLLLLAASSLPAAASGGGGAIEEYKNYLISLGFPADYADPLAELRALHPNWEFTPLLVTGMNAGYTWDYVVNMESEASPARSLVRNTSTYKDYHHPTNRTVYDTNWYQASREAVEYFMDPRNFLNEKDIFQFEMIDDNGAATLGQIEAALSGTFMAGARLENGRTYAEYFLEVGLELGISPLHLASRARQEQGLTGDTPQLTGLCGDRLAYYYVNQTQTEGSTQVLAPAGGHTEEELKSYNSLYNIFNINASGTGKFTVLLNAAKRARTGTPDRASEWGNGGAWDTVWKSIYGGAALLVEKYIKDYQNTVYLQKWNVDNRSGRNFWGQYMQHIGGALAEGRNSYTARVRSGWIDGGYSFLIPVYSGMPAECPDPARGYCGVYAMSDAKYSYRSRLTLPSPAAAEPNDYLSVTGITLNAGESIELSGWSVHTYGISGYEYSIDGRDWTKMTASFSYPAADENPNYINCVNPASLNSFDASIPTRSLAAGRHTLVLRGISDFGSASEYIDCNYYLIAEISFEIKASPETYAVVLRTIDGGSETITLAAGSLYTLPSPPSPANPDRYFAGYVAESASSRLFLPAGAELKIVSDLTLTPVTFVLRRLEGGALRIGEPASIRFSSVFSADDYVTLTSSAGHSYIAVGHIICKAIELGSLPLTHADLAGTGIAYMDAPAKFDANGPSDGMIRFYGDTAEIYASEYGEEYIVSAYVKIVYSDGSAAVIYTKPDRQTDMRSAKAIAASALADVWYSYTPAEVLILEKIVK